ncbi:MAG: alpha/beta fold hydrolase [Pararhodobacter sp.]
MLAVYDRWLALLPAGVARTEVQTRFGPTNVLVAGPEDAPPLMIHQGGNFPNPATLHWFAPLMDRFRVYAPDLPGAPGYSAPHHLDGRKGELLGWARDVLDALDLARVPHLGVSFGGGIILELARTAPERIERIERMALIAPAGLRKPAIWPLIAQLAVPMLRYRLRPTRANLTAAVAPLHSDPPSELMLDTQAAVFRHLRLAHRMPGPIADGALDGFNRPALIVGAERDPLFPGETLLARARHLLPQAETRMLPGSRHFPSAQDLKVIAGWLDDFLSGSPQPPNKASPATSG